MTDDELYYLVDNDKIDALLAQYRNTSHCGRIMDAGAFAIWAKQRLLEEYEDSLVVVPARSSRLLRVQRLKEADDD